MRRTTLFGTIVMAAATGVASAQSTEIGRIQVGPVAAAATAAPQVETVMVAPAAATTAVDPYDFGLIVQTLQGSVRPLSQELDQSFGSFTAKIEQAVTLMDEGRTEAAVELSVEAIQEVLAVRENVIEPMWEAQTYLASRIGEIRGRLATAVESSKPGQAEPDRSAEVLLDGIAKRINATSDPIRKQRLIAHYRTVRDLAAVRQKARKLTPDERNLWAGVLKVLDEAALAHQRVLMGSEVLFAQLESTAGRMGDYLQLVRTVQGVNELVAGVSGLQDGVGGMEGFVEAMRGLSTQLNGFDEAITSALESTMGDLEGRIDSIAPPEGDASAGVAGIQIDDELAGRLQKVGGN
ncbi:MAG: hypothetical protein ACO38W_07160 [Phycisphaerales bacterium]|jgi:hypothetical protein